MRHFFSSLVLGLLTLITSFGDAGGRGADTVYKSACEAPPMKPPHNLVFGFRYKRSDPQRAEIDAAAFAAYREQTQGLRIFEKELTGMANAYLESGGKNDAAARCALEWLYEWGKANAYRGKTNAQGEYIRQWGLAVVSSAYVQIKDALPEKTLQHKIIRRWLKNVAEDVISGHEDGAAVSQQNNHLYWAAWGVTITGIALEEPRLYEWGFAKARSAILEQIQPDGTLPLEMARGKKALHYHLFALTPLILIADMALGKGENLYDLKNGVLHTAVHQLFRNIEDPSLFERRADAGQDNVAGGANEHFAGLEVYNMRFPDPLIEAFLAQRRPIFSRRAGGDVRLLF